MRWPRCPRPAPSDMSTDPSARPDGRSVAGASDRPPGRDRSVLASTLRAAEWALAVGGLFLLTLGPVYSLREHVFGGLRQPVEDDHFVRAAFAAVYLATSVIWAVSRRPLRRTGRWDALPFLVGLHALALASALWSPTPSTTVMRAGLFLGTGVFGLWLAATFDGRQQAWVVCWAMGLGSFVSLVVARRWPRVGTIWGSWETVGIYFNRNSLAPVAAVGLVATAVVIVETRRVRVLPLIAVLWLHWYMLFASKGRTGLVVMAGMSVVAIGGELFVWSRRRWPGRSRRLGRIVVASGLVATVVAVLARPAVERRLGARATLTGRTDIWSYVVDRYRERPVLGWGFYAHWSLPSTISRTIATFGEQIPTAHNGVLEVLLGLGPIGVVLLVGALAGGLRAAPIWLCDEYRPSVWPVVAVALFVLSDITESFTLPNQFIWAILVAALVGGRPWSSTISSAVPPDPERPEGPSGVEPG